MKKILTAVLIVSAFLFACSNSSKPTGTESGTIDSKAESTTPAAEGSVQMPSTDNNAAMTPPAAASVQSSPQQPTIQQVTPQQVTPQQAATAPGMNPPHGEPGHRCDIAVGAPLNSAPAAPSAPPVGAPSMTITPPASAPSAPPSPAATTTTAPGMNPPHGQPGHDCAVPVGSPLPKK